MSEPLLPFAKQMRSDPTGAEACLWRFLRAGRLNQYKFKRQKPIAGYIVDFACLERKLIVEADGCQHLAQGDYDAERTRTLEAAGYFVLRFWNDEIMRDTQAVLNTILRALER